MINIGSIGSLYLTPITGPVIAKKYPIIIINLVNVIFGTTNAILYAPINAVKLKSKDMIVPKVSIERYNNPLLLLI